MQTRRDFVAAGSLAVGAALLAGHTASASPTKNRRIVLAKRPQGEPTPADFRLEEVPIPALKDGEILMQTVFLSLDPYMRGRMSEGPSYAASTGLNDVMIGGTVSRVIASRNAKFKEGDLVLSYSGWQEYQVSNGGGINKLDPRIPRPSYALGVLGMPGITAYVGTLDIGEPKTGETLVVAGVAFKGNKFDGVYLGGEEKGALTYAGKVEHGFSAALQRDLEQKAKPLLTPRQALTPAVKKPKATWVKPIVDAEIEYGALTDDGLLREAVFKGLRDDLALPAVHTPARSGRGGVPRENILQLLPDAVAPSKDELAAYWRKALSVLPELKFELVSVLTSPRSVTVLYKGTRGRLVAEVFRFDAHGKVCSAVAHYSA